MKTILILLSLSFGSFAIADWPILIQKEAGQQHGDSIIQLADWPILIQKEAGQQHGVFKAQVEAYLADELEKCRSRINIRYADLKESAGRIFEAYLADELENCRAWIDIRYAEIIDIDPRFEP